MGVNSPPLPRESTVRNSTVSPGLSEARLADPYSLLSQVPANNAADQFDKFFSVLMSSSNNDLSTSALGTMNQISAVAAAIKQQHGIIQAQTLNGDRLLANETNATVPFGVSGKIDFNYTYEGTLTDPLCGGRGLCVSQDAASTYVLAVLLGTALLLFVLS